MIIEKAEIIAAETGFVPEKQIESQVAPQAEQPPPYVEGPASSKESALLGSTSRASVFHCNSQQHVNYITLESKHNSISGSYIINPELPGSPLAHTRMLDRREQRRLTHNIVPNASFKTKHGAVNLNLATAGESSQPMKTYVQVSTVHGKVNVNLFSLQPNRTVCMEISTRHGSVNLLIPPSFRGALRLSTRRRSSIRFLKTFAEQARIIHADDESALVLFGAGEIMQAEPTSVGLDYCAVSSRHGQITIGVSGSDLFEATVGTSLIKKLGELVLGQELMKSVDRLRERGTLATPHQQPVQTGDSVAR